MAQARVLLHRQSTNPAHCLLALLLIGGLCAVSGNSICTPESGHLQLAQRSPSKPIVYPPNPKITDPNGTDVVWTFNFSHECTLLLEKIEFSFTGACKFQLHNSEVGLEDISVRMASGWELTTIDVNERTANMMGEPRDTNDGSRYFTFTAKRSESAGCNVSGVVLRTEDVDECKSMGQSDTLCPSNKECVNMIGTYGCCSRGRDREDADNLPLVTDNHHYRPCASQTTASITETRPTFRVRTIGANDTHVTSAIAMQTMDTIAFWHQHTIAAVAISCSSVALFVIVLLAIWQRGYLSNSATGFV
ncbi:uncharacterized protein LOC135812548 [Sycon ciliatum]|uniref:uncharacterized protein LOC135812548 n=1 Tax=Sycon ciliatum TaxID=27933 RepID=UPI0031F66C37